MSNSHFKDKGMTGSGYFGKISFDFIYIVSKNIFPFILHLCLSMASGMHFSFSSKRIDFVIA